MQLAERHILKSTEQRFAQIDELAFKSKNLYNAANYAIRQSFVYGWMELHQLQRNESFYEVLSSIQGFACQSQSANLDDIGQELEIIF